MQKSESSTKHRGAAKAPGINGFKYRERFGVIVLCKDAAHQERLYDRLRRAGHKLRVVTV